MLSDCVYHPNKPGSGGYVNLHWKVDGQHRHIRASRLAYMSYYGPIPDGLVVRHKCDNPACINPVHLEVGTQADNMRDRENRGRGVRLTGAASPKAKLTAAEVAEIKTSSETYKTLAARYKVSLSAINHIKNRRSWK